MLLVVIVCALAILGPLAALVWWIICEVKASEVGQTKSVSELLANPEEQAEIDRLGAIYEESLAKRALIEEWATDNHVPHRSDGMYDGRSRNGREANCALERETEIRQVALTDKLQLTSNIESRVANWLDRRSNVHGARAGLVWYLPLLLTCYLVCHNLVLGSALTSMILAGVIWWRTRAARSRLLVNRLLNQVDNIGGEMTLLPAA